MDIRVAEFADLAPGVALDEPARRAIELMASGGDARIALDPATGLNGYLSAPYPRRTLAYASSTANDLSLAGFAHARACVEEVSGDYAQQLERLRARIRGAYGLDESVGVVFAPSGTDLEYVALASVRGRGERGVHNILLGADEVGSGCIHSAHGRFFAGETALGIPTEPGQEVPGLGPVSLADVPVRCVRGLARSSADIAEAIALEVEVARSSGRHALVHVVHGSKTGLILPELPELDALAARFGEGMSVVVDACQARITSGALRRYLDRGAIVFLTGSKFMGGAPFSGFALVPPGLATTAAPLPRGFAQIFRRAEWPEGWAGREILPAGDNPGLWLRLEGSIFELERFQRIPMVRIKRIIAGFQEAMQEELAEPMGLSLVAPTDVAEGQEPPIRPIEMLTLVTLDVSALPAARTFAQAQDLHRRMALAGVRLGQPVKCVRRDGEWGGTLRVGVSMPQVSEWAALDDHTFAERLRCDMRRIAGALRAAT